MSPFKSFLFPALFAAALTGPLAPSARAQTSGEDNEAALEQAPQERTVDANSKRVLENYYTANGGLTRMLKPTTLTRTGYAKERKDEYSFILHQRVPNLFRLEETRLERGKEQVLIRGFDGESVWTYDLSVKKPDVVAETSKGAIRVAAKQYPLPSPLITPEASNVSFSYIAQVKSRGVPQHLLEMTFPDGKKRLYYFDAKTFFLSRETEKRKVGAVDVNHDTFYTRYEQFDGVWIATRLEYALEEVVYERVFFNETKVNPNLKTDLFSPPEIEMFELSNRKREP